MRKWVTLIVTGMAANAMTAHAGIVNLAGSATGFGLNPVVGLNQGSPAGIADRGAYDWNLSAATSPRTFLGGALSPYMTWPTVQAIRSTRIYGDVGLPFTNIKIDRLTGADPTNNAHWTQIYDSGRSTKPIWTSTSELPIGRRGFAFVERPLATSRWVRLRSSTSS